MHYEILEARKNKQPSTDTTISPGKMPIVFFLLFLDVTKIYYVHVLANKVLFFLEFGTAP